MFEFPRYQDLVEGELQQQEPIGKLYLPVHIAKRVRNWKQKKRLPNPKVCFTNDLSLTVTFSLNLTDT